MALIWYTKFDFVVVVSLNIDKDRKYRYYQGIRGKTIFQVRKMPLSLKDHKRQKAEILDKNVYVHWYSMIY